MTNAAPIQQYQIMIVDKPLKARGRPVTTLYAVAATSRDEAIAAFDDEIGAHHREMAIRWACTESKCRVLRAA